MKTQEHKLTLSRKITLKIKTDEFQEGNKTYYHNPVALQGESLQQD